MPSQVGPAILEGVRPTTVRASTGIARSVRMPSRPVDGVTGALGYADAGLP
jgi:hypothetical protein